MFNWEESIDYLEMMHALGHEMRKEGKTGKEIVDKN